MHEIIFLSFYILILAFLFKQNLKINLYVCLFMSLIVFMIIFINVNPYKTDENKLSTLNYISDKYKPKSDYLTKMDLNEMQYPFIIKPNVCSKQSIGVAVIRNKNDYDNYFKSNSFKKEDLIYQNFIPHKNEVGILYEKDLITGKGKIISVVKKNSANTDIMPSCSFGVTCSDLTEFITPELDKVFDEISRSIPNYNAGRFDVKYKDEKSLFEGKDLYILEANGTMGFDLRKGTTNIVMASYYINRWIVHRILYGIKNIVTFNGYDLAENFIVILKCFNNLLICKDWEKLFARYI